MDALTLAVERRSELPVYEQIARQLRDHIGAGRLAPGTALPTVRALAGDLGVNLNTVARAYRRLEAEGFVSIRGRSGVRVLAPRASAADSDRGRLRSELRGLLGRMRQAGFELGELHTAVDEELRALVEPASEREEEHGG